MKTKYKFITGISIVILLLLIVTILIPNIIKMKKKAMPECFIAQTDNCPLGYDSIGIYGSMTTNFLQCCKKPHYVLQGDEVDLFNSLINDNSHFKSLFDAYNCSFELERKLYCTDVSECYERPELEGCHYDGCNWCCGNTCTLRACISLEGLDMNKVKR